MSEQKLQSHKVWDRTTRWFHWVNFLSVFILLILGTVILNGGMFGLSGEGKVMMKQVHVYAGYVFTLNLLWRLIWGFIGGPYARWNKILPVGKDYGAALKGYIASIRDGKPKSFLGHSPLGRIAVTVLILSLVVQAVTGIVVAGTDIYGFPLGDMIRAWVAADGVDPATLVAGSREATDPDMWAEMRAFRSPYIKTHVVNYYVIIALIVAHISMVVWTEIKGGGTLISAMFTGRKVIKGEPEDRPAGDN